MLLSYHSRWIRPLGMFGSSEWWGNFVFFVAGMELRSCERTPHRSQGPQNAYSLPGASFIPVVGRPWPIQLRSPRYLVSSLTSWCGVLYISVSISWTRSFLLPRTHRHLRLQSCRGTHRIPFRHWPLPRPWTFLLCANVRFSSSSFSIHKGSHCVWTFDSSSLHHSREWTRESKVSMKPFSVHGPRCGGHRVRHKRAHFVDTFVSPSPNSLCS